MTSKFKDSFIDIVSIAKKGSDDFYNQKENHQKPNPYFIGFGNPNSDLLFLGKEKGFDPNNSEQLKYESIQNPEEWQYYVENGIPNFEETYDKRSQFYTNALCPYSHKMKSGQTWNKYGKLTSELTNNAHLTENNAFLQHAFLSEINHEPSRYSKTQVFNNVNRLNFLKNPFYQSFKYTILGCGNYLSYETIESTFDLTFYADHSMPRQKLVIFKKNNRKLVLTRQLSMDVSNEFISKLVEHLK